MAITLAVRSSGLWGTGTGNQQYFFGTATFDSSYATGGESISAANLDMATIHHLVAEAEDGYNYRYDYTNSKLLVYGSTAHPGIINDDDSAATNGADLQIAVADHTANVVEENAWTGVIGSFEAINAGDATIYDNQVGTATAATNPTYIVWDNDNAETETAAMVDLYIQAAGAGFNANNIAAGQDVYVPTSTGHFFEVPDAGSPAGVQVYYDDDATNAHERMLAVVADNADETFTLASDRSWASAQVQLNTQVPSGTDLSGAVVRIAAWGTPAN